MSFIEPGRPREITYPFPPLREQPKRTEPLMVPLVEMPPSDPARSLRDRRTLMVSGRLDDRLHPSAGRAGVRAVPVGSPGTRMESSSSPQLARRSMVGPVV